MTTVPAAISPALTDLFESVAVAIVALITFRYDLRARLRQARPVSASRSWRRPRP